MSHKGGQIGEKHGGAHGVTHGADLGTNISSVVTLTSENTFLESPKENDPSETIQDGRPDIDSAKPVSALDTLHFLSSDTEDLESYERAVVENNAEWLKSRCKNLDGVDFDIPHSNDESLVLEKKDDGVRVYLFGGDSLPETDPEGAITIPPLCNDEGGLRQDSVLFRQTAVPMSDQHMSIPMQALESCTLQLESPKECLQVLAPGLDLNHDKSIFNSNRKDLHNLHLNISSDRSNTLMTPQELEAMPDRGLEFEESVGPKTDSSVASSLSSPSKQEASSGDGSSASDSETVVVKAQKVTNPPQAVLQHAGLGQNAGQLSTVLLSMPSSNHSIGGQTPSSSSVSTDSMLNQGNLTLATISISTDKASNSTQILVNYNTNQGQQLYHINTSDLTQATNAMEPLLRSQVEAPRQIRVENGQIGPQGGMTGYLIFPVARGDNGDSSNGLLMSVPMATISAAAVQDGTEITTASAKKLYLCPEEGCDKMFRKLSKLKIHQMRHTGERPFKCSRHGCDWAFTTHYKLKRHEESHEGRKDFICDFAGCGRKFTTVYNLNSHRKLHERPCEACPEPGCGQSFPTKRQLDLHMKNHNGIEKTYKCPVEGCDKVFFSANCMGSHPRVHQQDREDLVCKFEGCGKIFDKVCRLKQHMRSHTGEKPYTCRFDGCGWAFTTASKLKRHMAKHTGLRKWVCNVCEKGFMRAEHLKGHLITHSGVKPFSCPVEGCKGQFTAKSSLYVHLKKHDHSGEKIIYHCPMEGCEKKYSTKASLRQHILKHFPASLSAADAANLELVPLLAGDDLPEGAIDLVTHSDTATVTSANINQGLTTNILGGHNPMLIDPSDFITTSGVAEQALITSAACAEAAAQQLTSSVVSQLINSVEVQTVIDSSPQKLTSADKQLLKISIASDVDSVGSIVLHENNSGSARTDYRSNHFLSDRARKRRRLLKEKGTLGECSDITGFKDVSEQATETVNSSTSGFSAGITFRDPETGVLYVQTQLLQDDPPNPEMYTEDVGLGSDLHTLHEVSASDITDQHTVDNTFTGSTINLQDLE